MVRCSPPNSFHTPMGSFLMSQRWYRTLLPSYAKGYAMPQTIPQHQTPSMPPLLQRLHWICPKTWLKYMWPCQPLTSMSYRGATVTSTQSLPKNQTTPSVPSQKTHSPTEYFFTVTSDLHPYLRVYCLIVIHILQYIYNFLNQAVIALYGDLV